MKTLPTIVCVGIASSVALLVGCQTPGTRISLKESSICPECKTETKTTALKGLNISKHLCPTCETEYDYSFAGYSQSDREVVHTCTACEALVKNCPQCVRLAEE